MKDFIFFRVVVPTVTLLMKAMDVIFAVLWWTISPPAESFWN
jgi:hypothetical protein